MYKYWLYDSTSECDILYMFEIYHKSHDIVGTVLYNIFRHPFLVLRSWNGHTHNWRTWWRFQLRDAILWVTAFLRWVINRMFCHSWTSSQSSLNAKQVWRLGAWMSNFIHVKYRDAITHPRPNFYVLPKLNNGCDNMTNINKFCRVSKWWPDGSFTLAGHVIWRLSLSI